jgi:uncharacterized membrane protein
MPKTRVPRETNRSQRGGSDSPLSQEGSATANENVAAHTEQTIRSMARLHAEHHQSASPLERILVRLTTHLARPLVFGILTLCVVGWIGLNLLMPILGHHAPDPPPFTWLSGTSSVISLYVVVLILITQRSDDELAQHREQLALELAILSEQKTAKVIQLLEELRRDSPQFPDRLDPEAKSMAQPANPQTVLDAIKETHATKGQVQRSARRKSK